MSTSSELHVKYSVGRKDAFPSELSLLSAWSSSGTTIAMATTSKRLDLSSKRKKPSQREGNVWMISKEGYTSEMRRLYIGTAPIFSSAQLLWEEARRQAPGQAEIGLPSQQQIEIYTDLWARYRRQIDTANDASPELLTIGSIVSLVQLLYLPPSGFAGGVVGEELLDWFNLIDARPTQEELGMYVGDEPWKQDGFWYWMQRTLLRGHTSMIRVGLEAVAGRHPSEAAKAVSRIISPLILSFPRANTFDRQSQFEEARFRWDAELKTARRNAEGLLKNERGDWADGLRGLVELMDGQEERLFYLVRDEGGWAEAAATWGIWIDPSMTRTDLSERVLDIIFAALPYNPADTLDTIRANLMLGQTAKVLASAAEGSTWLAAHLVDVFQRLQFLDEQYQEGGEWQNIRSYYLLEYCDHLLADPSMFQIAFDYARHSGPAGRIWLAENITKISLGLGAAIAPPDTEEEARAANAPADGGMELDVVIIGKPDYLLPGDFHQLEKLIRDCMENDLEAELQEICKVASETLVRQRKYGLAVVYAIRARDLRRLRWISERLLGEYVRYGAKTFLQRAAQLPDYFLLEGSEDEVPMPEDSAIYAVPLKFVCRYYLFQKLYSEMQWREAAELVVLLLKSRVAPKKWWGVLLWDTLAFLQEGELLIDYEDTLELLRFLEEIYMGAAHGCADEYLAGMVGMLTKGEEITREERKRVEKEALDKLGNVRLALARQIARCCVVTR